MKSVQPSDRFLSLVTVSESVADFALGAAPYNYTVTAASGTIAYSQNGLSLTTQAADNAIASAICTNKHYLPAAGKSLLFTAKVLFAEAATNAGNVYVGMTSSTAAASLGDNGAGPASSYSGIGFYKVDGSLNWFVEASNGSTQDTVELTANNSLDGFAHPAGSSAWQILEIDVKMKTSTKCDVMFRIDGVTVRKITDWTWTSMVAMGEALTVKAGSSTAEVLLSQYCGICKNRV